jgi:hypothetical protein
LCAGNQRYLEWLAEKTQQPAFAVSNLAVREKAGKRLIPFRVSQEDGAD